MPDNLQIEGKSLEIFIKIFHDGCRNHLDFESNNENGSLERKGKVYVCVCV